MKLYLQLDGENHVLNSRLVADDVTLEAPWVVQSAEDTAAWMAARLGAAGPSVPEEVTPAQMRQWLIDAGKLAAVNAAIDNPAYFDNENAQQKAKVRWEYATAIRRNEPLVISIGTLLGMTSGEMDQAFVEAEQYP